MLNGVLLARFLNGEKRGEFMHKNTNIMPVLIAVGESSTNATFAELARTREGASIKNVRATPTGGVGKPKTMVMFMS